MTSQLFHNFQTSQAVHGLLPGDKEFKDSNSGPLENIESTPALVMSFQLVSATTLQADIIAYKDFIKTLSAGDSSSSTGSGSDFRCDDLLSLGSYFLQSISPLVESSQQP